MSTSSNGIDQPPEMRDNDFFTDIPSGHKLPLGWVECAWQPEVTTKQQALCNEPGRLVATNGGTPAMAYKKGFTRRRGTMKAIIFYDDVASAARAVVILRRCMSLARGGARWDIKPWCVGVLKLPLAADEALIESIDADVIVFAALRAPTLPKSLKEWLQWWNLRRQSREPAVVITRAYYDARRSGFDHELLSFAAQNELDLIVEANPPVGDRLADELVQPKMSLPQAAMDEATMGAAVTPHYSYRNWGINE
ncbi:MAG TPA: hypothetical protein VFE51_15880 [Verrucomicrobiae bacterium]|nr:hypothetical protein [Verrucomicrobiae bacterium]